MEVLVILKSGAAFTTVCEKFEVSLNHQGTMDGYNIEGIKRDKPVYIKCSEVAAIIRKGSLTGTECELCSTDGKEKQHEEDPDAL